MALIQNNAAEKTGFLDFQIAAPSKTDSGSNFEQIMKSTKDTTDSSQQSVEKSAGTVTKPDGKDTMKEKLASVTSKAHDKMTTPDAETDAEEVAKAVGALIGSIRELLMQVFEVSEEELDSLMTEMGFTDADLLDSSMLDQLAIDLTGAEEAMDLLFQPEVMDTLKELKQSVADLKADTLGALQISEQEAQTVLAGEKPDVQEKDFVLDEELDSGVESVQAKVDVVKTEVSQEKSADDSEMEEQRFDHLMNHQTVNPILEGMEQAVEEVLPEVDAQDIVSQIVERVRVSVSEDTTSFEMQLNPEHLGKINLQIAAKNGVVTAQIATENAAVKEALESQIAVLKENLDNQGIKVESVEVTIASHEFERNLDEEQKHGQEQEGGQKRRFRFDVMEAAEEELTPADALVRDMMLADGNKINYMA